jgi:hypothetical protein
MAKNDHLNPQGLTPGIGPHFDPSKPSAKQKYARKQIEAGWQADLRADSEKKWQGKQSAKYDAIKAHAATLPSKPIPGVPSMLEHQANMRVVNEHYERMTAKKPGLMAKMHRALNIRQHLGRKK